MDGIYERIAEESSKLGLTGKDLGKLLGLKKSPLTDWKNKKSCPTLGQVAMMCAIFAVSSDYLIFGRTTSLSADEAALLKNYQKLDSFGQQRIQSFIQDELQRIQPTQPEVTMQKIG
ncbi:MAG: helix-turn-helix domain-containing protein [Clostridium sp.]|jgi:transcriptional regulator with XRE-family HTH domain